MITSNALVAELKNDELLLLQDDGLVAAIDLSMCLNGHRLVAATVERREQGDLVLDCGDVTVSVDYERDSFVLRILRIRTDGLNNVSIGMRVAADAFRTFICDKWNDTFHCSENQVVYMSSSDLRNELPTETWMLSPQVHCCALRATGGGWTGVSVPGPLSLGKLSFGLSGDKFEVGFYNLLDGEMGLPEIHVTPGLSQPTEALRMHTEIARRKGQIVDDKKIFDWWYNPFFCTWGTQFMKEDDLALELRCINDKQVGEWVDLLEERTGNKDFTVIIDIGWYIGHGDFRADDSRFHGMRRFIDELKTKGHHVLLWMSTYFLDPYSEWAQQHPETIILGKDGKPAIEHSFWTEEKTHYLKDYSVPKTRDLTRRIIRYCLSDEEGCLNADGFKLDFNYQTPNLDKHVVRFPEWGVGDLMFYKVMKLFHETMHSIKPDSVLTASCGESYLQPYMDMLRLNDHFGEGVEEWAERAATADILLPGVLRDMDGWALCRGKERHYWMMAPVLGLPSIHHVEQLDDLVRLNNEVAPVPHQDRILRDADWNRLSVAWHVYNMLPHAEVGEIVADPVKGLHCRAYKNGQLGGFYSAVRVNSNCFAIYTTDGAYIAATDDMDVELQLPECARLRGVELRSLDGAVVELMPRSVCGDRLGLHIEDAAHRRGYVCVQYDL